jgi:hypothetical protein
MFASKLKVHGTVINVDPSVKGTAPITEESLNFIQMHTAGSTVLEIGCGSGIYARLLRDRGVEVIATDACRINKEGLLPPNNNNRMAEFTNSRAIPNMIEENAVSAVEKFGQNPSLSLFLSFPLPVNYRNSRAQYDETALRNFKGNKFFLIAYYQGKLPETEKYQFRSANEATGSKGLHSYLSRRWNVKDKLLLETGRLGPGTNCYLIYFERKKKANNMSAGTNRKCPKNNSKDFKLKTVMKGIDGNLWIVSKRSDGVIFWKKK